jgi:hypothetical protein
MVEIACSLDAAARGERVTEFQRLFTSDLLEHEREPASLRLVLATPEEREGLVRDLFAREVLCCPFFSFDIERVDNTLSVHIGVPEEAASALDEFESLALKVAP